MERFLSCEGVESSERAERDCWRTEQVVEYCRAARSVMGMGAWLSCSFAECALTQVEGLMKQLGEFLSECSFGRVELNPQPRGPVVQQVGELARERACVVHWQTATPTHTLRARSRYGTIPHCRAAE